MKIKLNRDLWNHKAGEKIEVSEVSGTWAVNRGHASMIEIEPMKANAPAQNKAIEPKYEHSVTFSVEGRKLTGVLTKPQKKGRK